MRQTLVEIPYEIGGVPLFGVGVLLALCALLALGLIAFLRISGVPWKSIALQIWPLLLVALLVVKLPAVFGGSGLPVRGYGVMVVLGFACGVVLAMHRARQMGLNPDLMFSLAFWMLLVGVVGARAFHVIQKWRPEYERETWRETIAAVLNVPQGGLVVYGALFGAALAVVVFARRHRLPLLPLADLIAPSLLLGLALGRVGCLMNGCCFGGQCSLPWAVTFPAGSPPFQRQVERGELRLYGIAWGANPDGPAVIREVEPDSDAARAGLQAGDELAEIEGEPVRTTDEAQWRLANRYKLGEPLTLVLSDFRIKHLPALEPGRSLPVHPTQLYAAIGAALICLFLIAYYPYRRRDGEVIALALTIYAVLRFLEEAIRRDEPRLYGLTISQAISLLILLATCALWWRLSRLPRGSLLPLRS